MVSVRELEGPYSTWGGFSKRTFDGQGARDVVGAFFERDGRGGDVVQRRGFFLEDDRAGGAAEGPELEDDVAVVRVDGVDDLCA